MAFSKIELRDLAISVIALAIVFSYPEVLSDPVFMLVSLLTVGLAFFGHELSHKFVARNKGFWAEYRMWPQGLILAVVFAIASGGRFVFAAPGAVYFRSKWAFQNVSKREVGLIGISGIVFNLVLFSIFYSASLLTGLEVLRFAAQINVWLAVFNLIPLPPLDGSKVMTWNKGIWAAVLLAAIGGFLLVLF